MCSEQKKALKRAVKITSSKWYFDNESRRGVTHRLTAAFLHAKEVEWETETNAALAEASKRATSCFGLIASGLGNNPSPMAVYLCIRCIYTLCINIYLARPHTFGAAGILNIYTSYEYLYIYSLIKVVANISQNYHFLVICK